MHDLEAESTTYVTERYTPASHLRTAAFHETSADDLDEVPLF